MEEIEVNMNLISNFESPFHSESEIQLPIKQNKILSRTKSSHSTSKNKQRIVGKKALSNSKKTKWLIEKTGYLKTKHDPGSLTKIVAKRRKYTKSKKEDLYLNKNVEDPFQQLMPSRNTNETSRLSPVVNILEKYNFKYEVMQDSNTDNFFLQDKYMNKFFKYYAEYICIDFLCEIPELELNLCLFISLDGNGRCEITTIGLIKSFDSGLLWISDVFKKYNPNWHKIKVITCDKKANSLEVIKMAFPEQLVFVSFFHSLKALKNELSNLDPEVSKQDINEVIHIFEHMIYALDESSYSEFLKQLKMMPPSIVTYFRKVWHQKKESWILGNHLDSKIFLKPFNAYLLHIRKEMRSFVNTQNSTEKVIEQLCIALERMRKEKFQKFTSVFCTTQVDLTQIPHYKYTSYLTKYATELIIEQFGKSTNVRNIRKLSSGKYTCSSDHIITINACSCNFFQLFLLPCCHIFVIRKYLSLPLFVETLSSYRWVAKNYQSSFIDLYSSFVSSNKKCNHENCDKSTRFKKYFQICFELWPLLTEGSENTSQERMRIFKSILNVWKNGIKVNIKTSEIQDITSSNNSVSLDDISTDYWNDVYGISLRDILDSDTDFPAISISPEFSDELVNIT